MARKMPYRRGVGAPAVAVIFGQRVEQAEDTEIHPLSQHIAIRMLRQRFGFSVSTARMVAELAGIGAVGMA